MTVEQSLTIDTWLQILWDRGGSDLLLSGGSSPRIRVDGKLQPIEGAPILTGEQVDEISMPLLTPVQRAVFDEQQDVDFSFSWLDRARIRGSAFTQRGQTALALRLIPSSIPSFEQLGLPMVADMVAQQPRIDTGEVVAHAVVERAANRQEKRIENGAVELRRAVIGDQGVEPAGCAGFDLLVVMRGEMAECRS